MIQIRPFKPAYQNQTKALILAGLAERWGTLDPTLNPDLNDIAQHYADGAFVLAFNKEDLIGTGALIPEETDISRIVRMSVKKEYRRQGIGKIILEALIKEAHKRQDQAIVLETTATWHSAIQFYKQAGFISLGIWDDDHHFCLML